MLKTRSTQATSIDAAVVASLPRPQIAWTDYCTVLLIAQHRSAAKACAPLRMTHSTLLRKLDLIETRLKTRLF